MYRYIIIDDEPLTRKGTIEKLSPLSDVLQCIGEAENGEYGLALIEELHPDLVITDMKMPVMDGLSLLPVMAERYPDISLIVISGYQDFEYMRQAIHANAADYILKPFSGQEIISTAEKAIRQMTLKEQQRSEKTMISENYEHTQITYDMGIIRNMIEGYASDAAPFVSQKIRMMFQNRDFLLITLYCERGSLAEEPISAFLRDNHYGDSILYLPHSRVENLGFLVLTLPRGDLIPSKIYSRQIIRGISSLFWSEKQKVLYGISALHPSLADLSAAYKETARALDLATAQSPENILEYQNENIPPKRLSWPHTDELIFCVESGSTKEAGQLVDALFSYYNGISGLSLADIKFNCYHISSQLRYMLSYSIPELQVIRTEASAQSTLDTIFSVSGLHTYYRSYFTNIAQNLAAQDIYGDADLVNNVKTYIEHYYQKNISVELAASLFHVNRSYLSHIFKKRLGISFIDYLNQIRVSHAKELLTSSDKKMYQIALLSGYNNVRYFFRAFKKVEGVTPEQFRKAHE